MPRQDLAKAKEYLAKSKHPNGGIELDYLHVAGLEEARRIGLVLLDSLAELNIKVDLVPEQWPNMVAKGSKAETSPHMTSRLRDADLDRPRRGRLPVPSELVGPVFRDVPLRESEGEGEDRQGAGSQQVGRAGAALRRDPEADRRRISRRSSA